MIELRVLRSSESALNFSMSIYEPHLAIAHPLLPLIKTIISYHISNGVHDFFLTLNKNTHKLDVIFIKKKKKVYTVLANEIG